MAYSVNADKIKEAADLMQGGRKLARELRVGYSTVGYWLRGEKSPTIENALKTQELTNGVVSAVDILPDYPWKLIVKSWSDWDRKNRMLEAS